jgi:hypothetical protein
MAEQAEEYLVPLAELREAMAVRTQVAGILRQLRLENIKNKVEAEDVAAKQDFEVRKLILPKGKTKIVILPNFPEPQVSAEGFHQRFAQ